MSRDFYATFPVIQGSRVKQNSVRLFYGRENCRIRGYVEYVTVNPIFELVKIAVIEESSSRESIPQNNGPG